jgi:hypothetical protein
MLLLLLYCYKSCHFIVFPLLVHYCDYIFVSLRFPWLLLNCSFFCIITTRALWLLCIIDFCVLWLLVMTLLLKCFIIIIIIILTCVI